MQPKKINRMKSSSRRISKMNCRTIVKNEYNVRCNCTVLWENVEFRDWHTSRHRPFIRIWVFFSLQRLSSLRFFVDVRKCVFFLFIVFVRWSSLSTRSRDTLFNIITFEMNVQLLCTVFTFHIESLTLFFYFNDGMYIRNIFTTPANLQWNATEILPVRNGPSRRSLIKSPRYLRIVSIFVSYINWYHLRCSRHRNSWLSHSFFARTRLCTTVKMPLFVFRVLNLVQLTMEKVNMFFVWTTFS